MQLGNEVISTKDWVSYAQGNRLKQNGAVKPYQQLWDEFVQASALRYYQDHLEDFNEDFRRQITEFADGNLFFEIMQQKVWTPAQTDTTALLNYFNAHKDQYVWKESANAVIFYAANVEAANNFRKAWKSPADWKSVVEKYSEQITADSGRFELSQLPKGKQAKAFSKGTVTENEVNPTDNTVAFAYVIQLYKQQEPRSFNDAKGLVISDYQTELEKAWLAELKKKYPVSVNEKVWNELAKGLK
jgi:peptidyl-prolyl cis-trans isomerase SurA